MDGSISYWKVADVTQFSCSGCMHCTLCRRSDSNSGVFVQEYSSSLAFARLQKSKIAFNSIGKLYYA